MWCIGELALKDAAVLEQMTPKLRPTYSMDGSWYEILEGVMDLPPAARDEIRANWKAQQSVFRTPQGFAESFVDQNLT